MPNMTIQEVQAQLPQLIENMPLGEDVIILQDDKPVARLVLEPKEEKPERKLGTLKGSVLYMAPDFDAPLDDFKEYMP